MTARTVLGTRPAVDVSLSALEVAEAAVMAELTVGICLIGWLLPIGGVLIAAAVAPLAALSARHRLRTVIAGGVCAVVTATLIAGVGLASNVAGCAVLGAVVGAGERRGWSRRRTLGVAAATVWPVVSAALIASLVVLTSLRRLLLEQVTNSEHGVAVVLRHVHLAFVAGWFDACTRWLVHNWWIAAALGALASIEVGVYVAQIFARPTLARLAAAAPPSPSSDPIDAEDGESAGPQPVPVTLSGVGYRYPRADRDAVSDVSLNLASGELVALVGPNGSGKSTLARILAGRGPSSGVISRAGGVGLGVPGGTAIVFQRPESQVLGVRVADDVRWGLDGVDDSEVDVLLQHVGLAGFSERDTSTLSGGELQRLALAAALARHSSLLVSDETTSMVDAHGRRQIVELLRGLADDGMSVVHVTHRVDEAAIADRAIRLERGRVVAGPARSADAVPAPAAADLPAPARDPVIRLRGVGHVYDAGSPWAHRALSDVDLDIGDGEGVLVCGPNGSGKSTLAWILSGLTEPTEGVALLDTRHLADSLANVGLSFQHARLQLLRATVRRDVQAAGHVEPARADDALRAVGFDPALIGERRIDELSGGEQRRVALAGLLASDPRVLILDEPFAGLDDESRSTLTAVLSDLRARRRLTLVLISHDLEGCDAITDRVIGLDGGRIVSDARRSNAPSSSPVIEPVDAPARLGRRGRTELRLFRVLPWASPVHRLWAGTKLLVLVALAATVSIDPSWSSVAVTGALVAAGLRVARVPRTAVPRLPRWFWVAMGVGLLFVIPSGGAPYLAVGSYRIGLYATFEWLRATAVAVVLLASAALVSWTTPLAEITPALHRLARPFRLVRLPVDDWTVVTALGLRCLPILLEETTVLAAARRLRGAHDPTRRAGWRGMVGDPIDLLAAAAVTAMRRASEFADAIEARGGVAPVIDRRPRLGAADAVAFVLTAATIGLVVALSVAR